MQLVFRSPHPAGSTQRCGGGQSDRVCQREAGIRPCSARSSARWPISRPWSGMGVGLVAGPGEGGVGLGRKGSDWAQFGPRGSREVAFGRGQSMGMMARQPFLLCFRATHHFERFRLRSTRKHTNHIRVMSKLKVPRVVSIRKQASEVHEARGVCVTIADPALSCPILPLGRRLRLYPLPLGRRWSGRTRCIAARRCSAARRGGWRPLPLGCG